MADGNWSVANAKARFSEVIERALHDGPQHITRHGKPAVVVVPEDVWSRASGGGKSIIDVLLDPSIRGLLTDEERETLFARDRDPGRPIDL